MCGRFSLAVSKKKLQAELNTIEVPDELTLEFNIAPTHNSWIITNEQTGILTNAIWGLIPHWAHMNQFKGNLINARCETLFEKLSFKIPILQKRCIVLADSFYEWKKVGQQKLPYRILRKDEAVLCLAGVWDINKQGGNNTLSFSIITTPPNQEMATIHNRMPLILETEEAKEKWLTNIQTEEIKRMLLPANDGLLKMYPVSPKLNKVSAQGANLHQEIPEQGSLF